MAGRWTAPVVGLVAGLIVGLLAGQLVVGSLQAGSEGGGVEARIALFVVGAVVLAIFVIAGVFALNPARRRTGLALGLGAVGLVVGYGLRLFMH